MHVIYFGIISHRVGGNPERDFSIARIDVFDRKYSFWRSITLYLRSTIIVLTIENGVFGDRKRSFETSQCA